MTYNRDTMNKVIKILLVIFLINVIIRGINFVDIGMRLAEVKSFGGFNFQLFESVMDHSIILRIVRVGSDGRLSLARVLSTITIYDVMLIVSSLIAFDLNRQTVKLRIVNQTFLNIIWISLITGLTLFIAVLLSSSVQIMGLCAGIIYLLCAGSYIGVAITQLFKVFVNNEAS